MKWAAAAVYVRTWVFPGLGRTRRGLTRLVQSALLMSVLAVRCSAEGYN
jgi:hypothetical protein